MRARPGATVRGDTACLGDAGADDERFDLESCGDTWRVNRGEPTLSGDSPRGEDTGDC